MKKIVGFIRISIESGKANPSPPVGPALGLRGLNIMQFCKEFNNDCKSRGIKDGVPVPTLITVYDDKTFSFNIKTPSVSYFIKNHLNLKKGAHKPGKEVVGKIDARSLYEVAKIKQLNTEKTIESTYKSLVGSVGSMGVTVIPYKSTH